MASLIIDIHTHVYSTSELGILSQGGTSSCGYDGTAENLLRVMNDNGIANAVMLSFLPTGAMKDAAIAKLPSNLSVDHREKSEKEINSMITERYKRRNLWTCKASQDNPNLIAFIGVDPVMSSEEMRSEILEKVQKFGAKGLKFQFGEQRFYVNDRRMWPAYEIASELNLPVYCHSGRVETEEQYSEPRYFNDVLESFPKLNIIMGHLGFGYWDQTIDIGHKFPGVKSCCTSILGWQIESMTGYNVKPLSDEQLVFLIRKFGPDRIMWGSEYPFFKIDRLIKDIRALPLTPKEKRLILGENARRLLDI